jgi:predicted NAD/FAD-binding protein
MGGGMRVAVIGTGIAGNAAAWTLSKRYPVILYDREIRPGGHSHTVTIDYDGTQLAVDIDFIVYNELNYPELTALFAHLDIETVESCMSFAVTADGGRFEWKGGGSSWRESRKVCLRNRETSCRRRICGCSATSSPSTHKASRIMRRADWPELPSVNIFAIANSPRGC